MLTNCTDGSPGLQLLVDGTLTTVVLQNLQALTQYAVKVYSVRNEVSSEPLAGTETTCEFLPYYLASFSCQAPSSPFLIFCCLFTSHSNILSHQWHCQL